MTIIYLINHSTSKLFNEVQGSRVQRFKGYDIGYGFMVKITLNPERPNPERGTPNPKPHPT